MITLIVFIISLALAILLLGLKKLELSTGRRMFLADRFSKYDTWVLNILLKVKFWWSHVNFRNTKLFFSWLVDNLSRSAVTLKRRFDHKQSHFFTQKNPDIPKSKGSVSFFLKDVSEYKKNLPDGRIEK